MTGPSLASELEFALGLADVADAISSERFRALDLAVSVKADRSFVTDADRAVERQLRALIEQGRPGDALLGEEYGSLGDSPRQWIIDPIDGTSNFLRGVPVWATLIALAIDGDPVVGVVSMPALGRRWWAARSLGAHTRDIDGGVRSIHVSQVSEVQDASIALSGIDRFDAAGQLENYIALTRRVWRTRDYSDALPYMFVAEGVVDVAGEFDLQTYDMAALFPIIEEAGGTMTSIDGKPGPWHGSALATNTMLHSALISAFAKP